MTTTLDTIRLHDWQRDLAELVGAAHTGPYQIVFEHPPCALFIPPGRDRNKRSLALYRELFGQPASTAKQVD